jgi:hypothetical protein
MTMKSATKRLIQLNLRFCGAVALILSLLFGLLTVWALDGALANGAEPWLIGLLTAMVAVLLIFVSLFILSICLQFALIYLRSGWQENNQLRLLRGGICAFLFLIFAIPFLNLGGTILLAIAGLWSIRRVHHWFLISETEKAKRGEEAPEKAKRGFEEVSEKAKRDGGWQPSRFLIYTLVLLLFACAAYVFFVLQ